LDRKEHTIYYGLDGDMLAPFAQDTIEIMRKANIAISSTTPGLYAGSSEGLPRIKAAFAREDVAGFLLPSQAEYFRGNLEEITDPKASYDPYLKVVLANLRTVHEAGIRIVAGTDIHLLTPGLHWELEVLVKAGLSPLEALRTVTSNAAAVLGVEGRLGCISPGAAADLVVLDADPLEDIRNTQKIYAIIQGGKIIDRASLLKTAKRG
jgi:hypothetical protein